jgi:hypothetical protein
MPRLVYFANGVIAVRSNTSKRLDVGWWKSYPASIRIQNTQYYKKLRGLPPTHRTSVTVPYHFHYPASQKHLSLGRWVNCTLCFPKHCISLKHTIFFVAVIRRPLTAVVWVRTQVYVGPVVFKMAS